MGRLIWPERPWILQFFHRQYRKFFTKNHTRRLAGIHFTLTTLYAKENFFDVVITNLVKWNKLNRCDNAFRNLQNDISSPQIHGPTLINISSAKKKNIYSLPQIHSLSHNFAMASLLSQKKQYWFTQKILVRLSLLLGRLVFVSVQKIIFDPFDEDLVNENHE